MIRDAIHLAALANRVWDEPLFSRTSTPLGEHRDATPGEILDEEWADKAATYQRTKNRTLIVVIADTSGLLAALDASHPDGAAARTVLAQAGTLVVSPVLLAELDHVGSRVLGPAAAHRAIDDLRRWARAGRVQFPEITADLLDTAHALRVQYAGLKLDLADAVTVAVAAIYRTNAILTLDHRDYRAIAPLSAHGAFVLLPEDG